MLLVGLFIILAARRSLSADVSSDSSNSLSISWADQINGAAVSLPVNNGLQNYFLGFDKPNLGFQECRTSAGQPGRCRFLRYCAQPDILRSYSAFLLSSCIIDSGHVGVCCSSTTSAPHLNDNYLKQFKTTTFTAAVPVKSVVPNRTSAKPQPSAANPLIIPTMKPVIGTTKTISGLLSTPRPSTTIRAPTVVNSKPSIATQSNIKQTATVNKSPSPQLPVTRQPVIVQTRKPSVISQQVTTRQPTVVTQLPPTRQPTIVMLSTSKKPTVSSQVSTTRRPTGLANKTSIVSSTALSPKPAAKPIVQKLNSTSSSLKTERCGSLMKEDMRVVGGKAAGKNEWPWMAALLQNGADPFCGAVLITDQHVLTAAHCVVKRKLRDLKVRLGEYDFNQNSQQEMDLLVVKAFVHEEYNSANLKNDIALLKLQRKVSFATNVQPICLPSSNMILDSQAAYVAGWGTTSFGGSGSKVLLEVLLPIWKQSECATALKDNGYTGTQLCAGYKQGGKDSCQGDSGGPLMYQASRGKWVVIGLVSWGKGCASPNEPGVYTRITSYLPWIRDKILADAL